MSSLADEGEQASTKDTILLGKFRGQTFTAHADNQPGMLIATKLLSSGKSVQEVKDATDFFVAAVAVAELDVSWRKAQLTILAAKLGVTELEIQQMVPALASLQ